MKFYTVGKKYTVYSDGIKVTYVKTATGYYNVLEQVSKEAFNEAKQP